MDSRAIHHIVSTKPNDYYKPANITYMLAELLGRGVLLVEGEQHHRQRRIMNGAFGPSQIRDLTEIFVEKANQLRDNFTSLTERNGAARVDVLHWMSKATLDIIGAAGFNYSFDSLDTTKGPNELNVAFSTVFKATQKYDFMSVLTSIAPPLRRLPTERLRRIREAKATMDRLGLQLVKEKKAALQAESVGVEKKNILSRDMLSLLIKANIASDVPENQRLSDEEVLAQIPTFLGAGHETTSTSTTWCLFLLASHPDVQMKLRDELWSLATNEPTMDQLNSLPYLDSVCRETLRVRAPVPSAIRVAQKDDVIPLERPFVDTRGQVCSEIRVKKGQTVILPILALNRSSRLWGPDASEFIPERWQHLPQAVNSIPGVWSNIMTFLAGPHACIGYRFSIVEQGHDRMKALLFALVKSFEFELATRKEDIVVNYMQLVTRPSVAGELEKGNQMPLIVKPAHRV
ncbi:cytochrome P450 [Punctularia strigosozonata HHB-11173 SS5]|uniref:cytochrome P450 n=1 Tax=Punctularia strigosozonata (strain HHB-11173) TaxID=741275 RepID=UPI0004417AE9|nr:cytochrome P450 [Punctularia strigosozonata HHB-11173 SS5]EIN11680.1 cytochrome P450 [Punctularia strigosozonata HHB-11173 SS5]